MSCQLIELIKYFIIDIIRRCPIERSYAEMIYFYKFSERLCKNLSLMHVSARVVLCKQIKLNASDR